MYETGDQIRPFIKGTSGRLRMRNQTVLKPSLWQGLPCLQSAFKDMAVEEFSPWSPWMQAVLAVRLTSMPCCSSSRVPSTPAYAHHHQFTTFLLVPIQPPKPPSLVCTPAEDPSPLNLFSSTKHRTIQAFLFLFIKQVFPHFFISLLSTPALWSHSPWNSWLELHESFRGFINNI